MVTIRPSPFGRMALNAARQHRKEPVRLTRSVSSQISGVVSPNGATSSTAAAHTSAATAPASAAAAKRRSTSAASLTSAGTGVAPPPASRMRAATAARASRSRAASTTRAPAAARASAVAAPMPLLAPVTTATRPASQCSRSPGGCGPGAGTDDPSIELLMSVETPFQVEIAFGVAAAGRARDGGHPTDAVHGGPDVVGRDQEAGHTVHDHLAEPAAAESDHRGPAGLRLGGGHAEGLVPSCRTENHRRAGHYRPQGRSGHSRVNHDAGLGAPRADLLAGVVRVIRIAVQVDREPGGPGDVDGLGGSLL